MSVTEFCHLLKNDTLLLLQKFTFTQPSAIHINYTFNENRSDTEHTSVTITSYENTHRYILYLHEMRKHKQQQITTETVKHSCELVINSRQLRTHINGCRMSAKTA